MAQFEHNQTQREVYNPTSDVPNDSLDSKAMTSAEKKHAEATGHGSIQATNDMNHQIENTGGNPPPPSYQDSYPPVINGTRNIQVKVHTAPAKKSIVDAYILMIPLGLLGVHHFYLRRPVFGITYLFTFGLFGVGYVVDLFRLANLVDRANLQMMEKPRVIKKRFLDDAYVLWFPFGLLGFHHYYLRRPFWGLLYTVTFGLFGIGWIIDGCRMPCLVKEANKILETATISDLEKKTCDTYVMTIFPFTGILGFQHYYLGRYTQALFYTLTFGNMGVGWIVDLFRVPSLVKEYNKKLVSYESGLKRLDDAYMYLFPIGGLLGLHHFYLRRPGWGMLYLFTFGGLGVGYLIDLVRLYWLVKDHNKAVKEGRILVGQAGRPVAGTGNEGLGTTHTAVHTQVIHGPAVHGPSLVQGQVVPQSQTTQNIYTVEGQTSTGQGTHGYPSLYNQDQLSPSSLMTDNNMIPPSYDQVIDGDDKDTNKHPV